MADFSSIPFHFSHEQTHFRLAEIPEELLEIITKSDQPIYLKSSSSTTASKEGSLHLVTSSSSWLAKQVSTSNSVYITTSAQINKSVKNDHPSKLTQISKPTSLLEMHPLKPSTLESVASGQLEGLVPMVSHLEDIPKTGLSLAQVYGSITAPCNVIAKVLARMCAIETKDQVVLPSSSLLLETWKQLVQAATISSTTITADLDVVKLFEAEMDEDHSLQLIIANRMFDKQGYLSGMRLVNSETSMLKETEMTRWVGNLIVKVQQEQNGTLSKDRFEQLWEDHVPAGWVKYCSVEILDNACAIEEHDGREVVTWKPFVVVSETAGGSSTQSKTSAPAKSTAKGKKNWHEILAAGRAGRS